MSKSLLINRAGEEKINNFGSIIVITEYKTRKDIDIYFPEYNWTKEHATYGDFKNGKVKCPYEPRVFNIGYLGEGKYKSKENKKTTKIYSTWRNMLERCYYSKYHEKHPSYIDCIVCDEWHNFQNFAQWYDNNYYEIKNEKMCLDKDILIKGNKIYSPDTCVFVPQSINKLFTKRDVYRGDLPIGVYYKKQNKKYGVVCNIKDSAKKHLGYYDTPEEAFQIYKNYKEKHIKQIADQYKSLIPEILYNAMYEYEVEIDD